MQIDYLSIENFRPFQNLQVTFNPKLNVIIGFNGAGKTAILDSIAIAFVPFISMLSKNRSPLREISLYLKETDIHLGAEKSSINVSINYNNSRSCKWWLQKGFESVKSSKDYNYTELKDYIADTIAHLEQNPLFNLPIICFYSISRMNFDDTIKASSSQPRYEYNQFSAYKKSLLTGLNSFGDFIIWFEEEEGYEDKIRLETDNKYRNPKLEVVRNAIEIFLNGFESMSSTFKNIRIKKERNNNNFKYRNSIMSSLVIKKNDKDFQLEQLSSGEKMMIMLVVDIARRISIANPSLENPLKGEGIILIDEIDLHLHPQWQREMIPALTNTFPNCQFIITTHSPQVLSQVKKENIFIIEDNNIVSNPPHTYGKDANSILYEIFNTLERPKYIQDKLDECYKLIEMEKFNKTKEILEELTNILDKNDTEIVKIKSLLTFYEQ